MAAIFEKKSLSVPRSSHVEDLGAKRRFRTDRGGNEQRAGCSGTPAADADAATRWCDTVSEAAAAAAAADSGTPGTPPFSSCSPRFFSREV